VFAVFYGLDWVATVPPTVKLTARHFGPEKASLIFGWVFVGHQLGSAAAAVLAGIVRTGTESYYPAILLAGVFCLLAALLILTIGKQPATGVAVPAAG
jgi:predicted MFS family arabinose efflux permease